MVAIGQTPRGGEAAVASLSPAPLSLEERAKLQQMLFDKFEGKRLAFTMPLWLKKMQENVFLKKVAKYLPWAMLGTTAALRLMIGAPTMAVGFCLLGGVSLVARQLYKRSPALKRMINKVGQRRCFRLMAGLLFGGTLWMSQTSPVYAQFFQGAETFFNATFPDAAAVVPVIFGVIRALFLIYIAVALIRVVQAARNDDDWQQMARQPVIIVMAVVLGDVLTTLVIG